MRGETGETLLQIQYTVHILYGLMTDKTPYIKWDLLLGLDTNIQDTLLTVDMATLPDHGDLLELELLLTAETGDLSRGLPVQDHTHQVSVPYHVVLSRRTQRQRHCLQLQIVITTL